MYQCCPQCTSKCPFIIFTNFFCITERTESCASEDPSLSRSSSASDSSFQKLIECAVCLEILENPQQLKCQHAFCKECIDEWMKFEGDLMSITCPTCNTKHVFEDILAETEPSLLLKQMLDTVSRYNFYLWYTQQTHLFSELNINM